MQRALNAALGDLKKLPKGDDPGFEKRKASALVILTVAWSRLESGKLDDLETRLLFGLRSRDLDLGVAVKLKGLLEDEFPELQKLSGLVQLSLLDVEMIFETHDIPCSLALKLFCSAAERQKKERELAAQETRPSPLTCTA